MEIDAPSIAIGIIIGLLTGVFMTVFSVWILWDEIMFFVKQSESEAKYNKEVMYCSDRARPAWLTGFEFGCARAEREALKKRKLAAAATDASSGSKAD
eukprot:744219-Prorocentrum_minimum.AAC.2